MSSKKDIFLTSASFLLPPIVKAAVCYAILSAVSTESNIAGNAHQRALFFGEFTFFCFFTNLCFLTSVSDKDHSFLDSCGRNSLLISTFIFDTIIAMLVPVGGCKEDESPCNPINFWLTGCSSIIANLIMISGFTRLENYFYPKETARIPLIQNP